MKQLLSYLFLNANVLGKNLIELLPFLEVSGIL